LLPSSHLARIPLDKLSANSFAEYLESRLQVNRPAATLCPVLSFVNLIQSLCPVLSAESDHEATILLNHFGHSSRSADL
jgi:hypothetical protein